MADIHAIEHGRTVQGYLADIVKPAIGALDDKITALELSEEAWAPFAKRDVETLHIETIKAFALALQSLWERQLRDYVSNCAIQLKLDNSIVEAARSNRWSVVEGAFQAARGIQLRAFPSYDALIVLHVLGNVCRHGEGSSVRRLHQLRPEFWPDCPPLPAAADQIGAPSAAGMRLSIQDLMSMGIAITAFWSDAHTIYLQGLQPKHETVVSTLSRLEQAGAWMPTITAADR